MNFRLLITYPEKKISVSGVSKGNNKNIFSSRIGRDAGTDYKEMRIGSLLWGANAIFFHFPP